MGKAWLGLAALALPLASCSDWDDHYDPSTGDEGSKTTLWQAISSQSELSNFARVLKGCDYDRNLSGSQTYTVFALTNDGLTADQADSLVSAYQEQKNKGVRDNDNTVEFRNVFFLQRQSYGIGVASEVLKQIARSLNCRINVVSLYRS